MPPISTITKPSGLTALRNVSPNPKAGNRETVPGTGYQPYGGGSLGIIPRRGLSGLTGSSWGVGSGGFTPGLAQQWYTGNPLRLLEMLCVAHPMMKKAQNNVLLYTTSDSDTHLRAYKETQAGSGNDMADDRGSGDIEAFWESQPQETGGLSGLRCALTMSALHTGLMCLEVVPGYGGAFPTVWWVDPLTIEFARDTPTGPVVPYQRQQAADGGYKRLSTDTFFWYAIHGTPDNPYGIPLYSAALAQALAMIATEQDVRDAMHNSAWPRIVYKYALDALYEIAKTTLNLPESYVDPDTGVTSYPLREWVSDEITQIQGYLGSLKPDDNITVDAAGGVDTIEAGNFSSARELLDYFIGQFVAALNEMPATMGMISGSTETFTSVQFQQYAKSMEWLRAVVMKLPVKATNLMFRLRGQALTPRVEFDKIRTVDVMQEANARSTDTATTLLLVDRGYHTDEEACILTTGSGLPDDFEEKMKEKDAAQAAAIEQASLTKPGKAAQDMPQNVAGSTQEERQAAGAKK